MTAKARTKWPWWKRLTATFATLLALGVLLIHLLPALFFHPVLDSLHSDKPDALIVLGVPAQENGQPSAMMAARVDKAMELFRQGVAPRLIMCGGAAHNPWVEAEVMKTYAISRGAPESSVLTEGDSKNTAENMINASRLMAQHQWRRAVIVTSDTHIPRAAYFAARHPIQYAMVGTDQGAGGLFSRAWVYEWEHLARTRMVVLDALGMEIVH